MCLYILILKIYIVFKKSPRLYHWLQGDFSLSKPFAYILPWQLLNKLESLIVMEVVTKY